MIEKKERLETDLAGRISRESIKRENSEIIERDIKHLKSREKKLASVERLSRERE